MASQLLHFLLQRAPPNGLETKTQQVDVISVQQVTRHFRYWLLCGACVPVCLCACVPLYLCTCVPVYLCTCVLECGSVGVAAGL